MFQEAEKMLLEFSSQVSVEVFTIVAAFVEEIVAPIPSPLIMMTAGVLAYEQSYGWLAVLFLALIGAVSKTCASFILYFFADKLEDVVMTRFGKFIGISHEMVQSFGSKLNKSGRDYLTMFLLRAIPVVPSAPISLIAGFVKVNPKAFVVGTFTGTIIRNLIYLILGFKSFDLILQFRDGLVSIENLIQIVIILGIIAGIVWVKLRKR